jgi:hypothetical protein
MQAHFGGDNGSGLRLPSYSPRRMLIIFRSCTGGNAELVQDCEMLGIISSLLIYNLMSKFKRGNHLPEVENDLFFSTIIWMNDNFE